MPEERAKDADENQSTWTLKVAPTTGVLLVHNIIQNGSGYACRARCTVSTLTGLNLSVCQLGGSLRRSIVSFGVRVTVSRDEFITR